jgi:hypothetical protein
MSEEQKNIESSIMYDEQPSENMEVHHHPQVEKKNFKEYLPEGLMIFLAVTMGSLAESLRENLSEKEKGKEHISSFASNLQQGATNLKYAISDNENKGSGLGSLIYL